MLTYSEFSWLRIADFPQNYQAGLRTDDYQDYLINARPDENYDIKNYQVTSTSITRHLDEGDVIDLGDKALTVYHLPGHSPGSIGLWDPSGRTLFSGDALYDGQLFDQLPRSNIPDYINTLKIDKSFVSSINASEEATSFVDAIVAMAKILKLNLIAEGVETDPQLEYLKKLGCGSLQGYLFGKAEGVKRTTEILSCIEQGDLVRNLTAV